MVSASQCEDFLLSFFFIIWTWISSGIKMFIRQNKHIKYVALSLYHLLKFVQNLKDKNKKLLLSLHSLKKHFRLVYIGWKCTDKTFCSAITHSVSPSSHSYIYNGLFGLGHVGDDAVCDDEEHKVLRAILHCSCIPAHRHRQRLEEAVSSLYKNKSDLLNWFIHGLSKHFK